MKVIIDIPDRYYEAFKEPDVIISGQRNDKTLMAVVFNAVSNGTPLTPELLADMLMEERTIDIDG